MVKGHQASSCPVLQAEQMIHAQFSCLVCGVPVTGQLLLSPKETVAGLVPKHLPIVWWSSPVNCYQRRL